MLRLIPLLFVLACTANASPLDSKAEPAKPPRNLVCERVAVKTPKAECVPEYTDAGELHAHTARVTIGESTSVCGINVGQLLVVCDNGLFFVPKEAETPAEAPKTAPSKNITPAKAPKK